jgi:phosphoglycerol transferase
VIRNQLHLILSAYYFIPLVVMVLLWITTKQFSLRTKKFLVSALICVAVGSSGVYYPFFSCFMLLVAGAIAALKFETFKPLLTAFILVGIIGATVTINLSPSFIYRHKHGTAGVLQRNPGEAESFGLKISQLILPITGHRINALDQIKRLHNRYTWFNESDAASLGTVGTIGFLALLAQLLRRKEIVTSTTPGLFQDLSLLNLFALLLGLVGGFGYIFAVLISSGIRCYNRLSIFIAFFSLMAIGIGLEKIYRRVSTPRSIFCLLVTLALIAGILDQTTPAYVPNYMPDHAVIKAEYLSDEQFVNRIEASVPAGAMIFQLPYIQFPEQEQVQQMIDYDHFRGYVHSKHLRWSYGAMKNRDDDRVQERVAALPAEEFVRALAFGGFSGIYVDRRGYQDGGTAKESELSKILQEKPLISPDGRLLFFNITDYTSRLRQQYSDAEWQEKQELSFRPLLVDWTGGFSGLETGPSKTWRWSSSEGELHIRNISQRPRNIRLEMLFATAHEQMSDLTLTGLISEQLKVNSQPSFYSKVVTVPPGEAVVKFSCSAPRAYAPLDPRFLVFRVEDFKMTELQ